MERKSHKEKEKHSSRTKIPKTSPEYKFGTRLKEQMNKKGMKQKDLVDKMGVSESTVKDWYQHYKFPSEMNLAELCRIFAPCSMDYFHGNIDEPNYDVNFIVEYTGLSVEAVEQLHELKTKSATTVLPRFGPEEWTEEKDGEIIQHIGSSDFIDVNLAGILDKLLRNDDFVKLLKQLSAMEASTDRERVVELNKTLNAAHKEMDNSGPTNGHYNVSDYMEKTNRYNDLLTVQREYHSTPRIAKLNASSLFTTIMNTLWPTD